MTTIKESIEAVSDSLSTLINSILKAFNEKRAEPKKAPEVVEAIGELIRSIRELPLPAPDGLEFSTHLFLRCDVSGAETCLHFDANQFVPPATFEPVDVYGMIGLLSADQQRRLYAIGLWRVMTRDEIRAYKVRQLRARGH